MTQEKINAIMEAVRRGLEAIKSSTPRKYVAIRDPEVVVLVNAPSGGGAKVVYGDDVEVLAK